MHVCLIVKFNARCSLQIEVFVILCCRRRRTCISKEFTQTKSFGFRNSPDYSIIYNSHLTKTHGEILFLNYVWSLSVHSPSEGNLSSPASPPADTAQTYCYCHGPEEGNMLGCNSSTCAYERFHLHCLGLKLEHKSQHWYCPDCRKLPEFRKKMKRKTTTWSWQ